jgi:hypothetical protein
MHNPMTKVLGLHSTKVFYIQKEETKNIQRSLVYTTSALCSVAEEGVGISSPEADDGTGFSAVGDGAAGTAEAAEGEIVVSNAGANFFAFSKNTVISSRVWP